MKDDDPFDTKLEDYLNSFTRGAASIVAAAIFAPLAPVVSPLVSQFVGYAVGNPSQARRDDFFRDLAKQVAALHHKYESLSLDNLAKNEAFQATALQAAQSALRTTAAEKKEMLRNAVINSAIATVDETMRHIFMQCIDRLTVHHIKLLRLLDDAAADPAVKAAISGLEEFSNNELYRAAIPELEDNNELVLVLTHELRSIGLLTETGFGGKHRDLKALKRSTPLGSSLLKFVAEPP